MTVGNNPAVTQTKAMGDLNNGTYQVGLAVSAEVPTDNTPVVLSYVILNNGHEQTDVQKGVEAALTALGNAGVKAASTAVGAAIGAALGASLGTVAVPLIGTALGALSGWVVTEVGSILFADCDGPVAVGVHVYTGEQLTQGTAAGQKISESDVQHLGNPSPPGCGANSVYFTSDTISALQPTTQTDWQHCSKCAGLFFAGVDAGICPAGGNHSVSAGSNYGLSFSGVGAGSGQPDWKWCNQCQGLFYAGSSLGVCPSHSHNDAGAANMSSAHRGVASLDGNGAKSAKISITVTHLVFARPEAAMTTPAAATMMSQPRWVLGKPVGGRARSARVYSTRAITRSVFARREARTTTPAVATTFFRARAPGKPVGGGATSVKAFSSPATITSVFALRIRTTTSAAVTTFSALPAAAGSRNPTGGGVTSARAYSMQAEARAYAPREEPTTTAVAFQLRDGNCRLGVK